MKIEEKKDKFVITDFSELQAYKIACKIEEDGIRFYKKISESVKNKILKEKLEYLLGEEREHLKYFEECLSKMMSLETEDGFEDDDLLKYLDYGIFKPYQDMKKMGDLVEDVPKALGLGILMEDKSIKFYQACFDHVSSVGTKQQLQNIIKEENRHRALLEKLLDEFIKI